jgi:riboflavin synthase
MFTGLIEEIGVVGSAAKSGNGFDISVECRTVLEGIAVGDSISIDGVCQTVTSFSKDSFTVFASAVTVSVTTLAAKKRGNRVNLERALSASGRLGGHIVQGHVDSIGRVEKVLRDSRGLSLAIAAPAELMRYIAAKGSVAVNGVSLTVVSENGRSFDIYLIPETIQKTTIQELATGDEVNIETDILAKYVEKSINSANADDRLMKKLAENGFV